MSDTTTTTVPLRLPTSVPGLYVFGPVFEQLIDRLQLALTAHFAPQSPTRLGIPPVIPRSTVERAGYVEAFPHLLATVHCYGGDEKAWRTRAAKVADGTWTDLQDPTDSVVLPAVCYHLYPHLEGTRVDDTCLYDLTGHCYRHEATSETGRLKSFRMREFIRVGTGEAVLTWRNDQVARAETFLTAIGLDVAIEAANDPFFGAAARLMAPAQHAEELKWELVVPVADDLRQAVASGNFHKDKFGQVFSISDPDGAPAHTGCTAFGLERIALAVLHAHGPDPQNWPLPGLVAEGNNA